MKFVQFGLVTMGSMMLASGVWAVEASGVHLPLNHAQGVAQSLAQGVQTSQADAAKVNINAATVQELMAVKGLNASKARAIVSYRKQHEAFKSLEELAKVKGFMRMKSEQLKEIQAQLRLT